MSESRTPGSPAARALQGTLLVVVVLAAAGYLAWTQRHQEIPGPTVPEGHLVPTSLSPYKNTERGVAYVGDAACTKCHAEIAKTFHQHPMGRSMSPPNEVFPEISGKVLTVDDLDYSIERRDGQVFHRETRRDKEGKELGVDEGLIRFALGSGTRGYSFLVQRGNTLFQSPLAWYTEGHRWDLAPGYRDGNLHFDRRILIDCLFCHSNQAELPPNGPPVFQGPSIGCERCHGPGELHAKNPAQASGKGKDLTIVNPADLEPVALREAVCEQCHFQGSARLAHPGRSPFDYRPGLPFHLFVAVNPASTDPRRGLKAIGHVEQMRESRCYQKSEGRLGCTSCHDPHKRPEPDERVAYFKGRCLECHADRGCRLAPAERLAKSPADDCVSCHMPRSPAADIPHTAPTLHSIPRFMADSRTPQASPTADASIPKATAPTAR